MKKEKKTCTIINGIEEELENAFLECLDKVKLADTY